MLKGLRNKNDLTGSEFNDQFETEMLSGKEQYLKTEMHKLLKSWISISKIRVQFESTELFVVSQPI